MSDSADAIVDPPGIPTLSYILGFGPMIPIVAAGTGALLLADPLRSVAIVGGTGWAAALLIFVAGVRRGYGFATTAAPSVGALAGTFLIFGCGVLAMPAFLLAPLVGVLLLTIGFIAVAILDARSARRSEAPRHFARLRPPQMATGILGLVMIEVACISLS